MKIPKLPVWVLIFLAVIFGGLTGLCLHQDYEFVSKMTSALVLPWLKLPGDIFLNLLQMIMIPLVIASVAIGVSSLSNVRELLNLGTKVFLYFVSTTMIAITIGILLTVAIAPGKRISIQKANEIKIESGISTTKEIESVSQSISSIVPKNIISAIAEQKMLSLVFLGIVIGIFFLSTEKIKTDPLKLFLISTEAFCIWVVNIAMKIAPIAVFGLVAFAITQIGITLIAGLFYYVITVISGLLIVLLFYMILVFSIGKRNPFVYLNQIREVQLLAFSTSSSSSVLPVSLRVSKEILKVREKIADFVIPLGATVNMDGTALYQAVATIFLSQVYQIEYTTAELFLLVLTVTGASIGTAATPGVGIVILGSILHSFRIPVEGIAILFGVDRFLDMCRTSVNVSGDLTAAVILDRWWKEDKR